jgi:protocatechuate 3,4-dioxygenase, alpha subunit
MRGLTPSQTVGPFFHGGLAFPGGETLCSDATAGPRIRVTGVVRDGAGAAVPDAVIEVWQANAAGRYRHPDDRREVPLDEAFDGFGRIPTDDAGRFAFTTVKPGCVPAADGGMQAPHLVVGVLARGLLTPLFTRVYFGDEAATATDPILAVVPADRRATLIASRTADAEYRYDIVLQGAGETVFFDA